MTRDQAYSLMTQMIQNNNLRKHGLAVEAIMRALCRYLKDRHSGEDQNEGNDQTKKDSDGAGASQNDAGVDEFNEEEWAIVGLLHDSDYELIEKDPTRHTLVTEERVRPLGASERIINGIKAHHDGIKKSRDNYLEKSVYAADELSGLITAVALVKDKSLANVTVESVMKKFPEKNFAAGAKREQIKACEKELNIPLEEFVGIALKSMQGVSKELGL